MYGTVAHMKIKSGMEDRARELMNEFNAAGVPGTLGVQVYRLDANPEEYIITVAFDSRESYWANARSPEQDARYRDLREILQEDPEWHDGEIIYRE